MGILLSLSAALCWGVADFFAAIVSRRIGAVRAQCVTQCLELVIITTVLAGRGTLAAGSPPVWAMAVGLGLCQCVGLMLLYKAFEIGTLSIVAPVASSFVIFTALLAWLGGERAGAFAVMGAVLLFAGVVLVAQSPAKGDARRASTAGVWHALAAAISLSFVFWLFGDLANKSAPLWPLLPLRLCSAAGSALTLLLARPPVPAGPADGTPRRLLWPLVLVVVISNSLAWMSFGAASQLTYDAVVAALSSLFAAVTIFMAWVFLKERLARVQWVGVVVILVGVLLVSL